MALEIDRELMVNAVYAPALGDYCRVEKARGAWKMVSPSLFSSETELATVIVFTGFACLHNNPEQNTLERSCRRIARAITGPRRSVPSHSKWVWLSSAKSMHSGSRN